MKNLFFKFIIIFVLTISLGWLYLFTPKVFFSFDNRLRDFMFIMRGELPTTKQIVIIDIDEKSLQEYGQWPWPRQIISDLIYKLTESGAGIIGLDIVFAEKDRASPHLCAEMFPQIQEDILNYDKVLAKCFATTPVVGGYVFKFDDTKGKEYPIIPAIYIEKGHQKNTILNASNVVLNTKILQKSLYSSGFFNNTPDSSGMVRHIPLVIRYDGVIYPSLVLEMIRIYSGLSQVTIEGDDAGVQSIDFGNYSIPTDRAGRLFVNYRGKGKHFKYISVSDILHNNYETKDIENKFILVGTSAIGLYDLRSTPFDKDMAGIEIHANALDNILTGDYLHKPSDMILYDLIFLFLIILFSIIIFSLLHSRLSVPIFILGLYGLYTLFYQLLFHYGIVLNILYPLIAYIVSFIGSIGLDYIMTSKQKEQAKMMLGKKVSPAVMEHLLEHYSDDLVESRDVEATIFFSDIRSFTTISEKIGSPSKLINLLNEYMTPMVESIVKHNGTIDKFIGDAIMAYWNAPVEVKNHPDEAVKSAIEQIEKLEEVNQVIIPKYGAKIEIGIGIHTGVITAGDMGSQGRSDYTIIGDNVNLTSRLEGLTKQYGAQILISDATFKLLQGEYRIRPIDMVEVKGKNEAVEIHEVICNNKKVLDEEFNIYNEATQLFRASKVTQAYKLYRELEEKYPSILYTMYVTRCKNFIENPEIEFTPILKMTTK